MSTANLYLDFFLRPDHKNMDRTSETTYGTETIEFHQYDFTVNITVIYHMTLLSFSG